MANEFNRNLRDYNVEPAAFALPAAASSSTTSANLDLGVVPVNAPEAMEVALVVPALSDTIIPNTRTVTLLIESSTTSIFTAVAQTLATVTLTGAGAGAVAQEVRIRLPANCARYVRGKVTFGASTTDGSAISATLKVLF